MPKGSPATFFAANPGYRLDAEIGAGAYATVFRAVDAHTGRAVAVKQIHTSKKTPHARAAMTEYRATQAMDHPNIVRAVMCFPSEQSSFVVFELAEDGDLYERVEPNSRIGFTREDGTRWAHEIALALAHVHGKGYVHRDVKPENILLHHGNAKLCDFGLAIRSESRLRGRAPGTGAYMAPEVLAGEASGKTYTISTASDAWSFGIVLYAMLFADLPWESAAPGDFEYDAFLAAGGVMGSAHPFHLLSASMRRLMARLLAPNPLNRCTLAEAASVLRNIRAWYAEDEEEHNLEAQTDAAALKSSAAALVDSSSAMMAMSTLSMSNDSLDSLVDEAATYFDSLRF